MAEETIRVTVGPKNKGRVGIWDTDPRHPKSEQFPAGGEVYIAWDAGAPEPPEPIEVALTPAVTDALSTGRIVRAESPRSRRAEAEAEEKREEPPTDRAPASRK